eukprot:CAMPEP_0167751670 /NCGR_PEP_ID=MMETSP0110_2-20121227/6712_1 /TAXON_ID=629695 /ORGANISM="Gymnochlora sp., Strain CCMP2014" /LENGTH=502 /DNA_ID=CAMNT_0007637201 /DNA_START=130 /DNA_END=1638 /DNA_ORIENTATION=+
MACLKRGRIYSRGSSNGSSNEMSSSASAGDLVGEIPAAELMRMGEDDKIAHQTFPTMDQRRNLNHVEVSYNTLPLERTCRNEAIESKTLCVSKIVEAPFKIFLSAIGMTTVLCSPLAVAKAGFVPSMVLVLLWAVITDISLLCLVKCARQSRNYNYEELVAIQLGVMGRRCFQAANLIYLALRISARLIIFSDLLSLVIEEFWPSTNGWAALTSLASVIIFPVLFLRSSGIFKYSSVVEGGTVLLLLCSLVVLMGNSSSDKDTAVRANEEPSVPVQLLARSANEAAFSIPLFAMMYQCQDHFLASYREIPSAHKWVFPWLVHLGIGMVSIVIIAYGLLGSITMGKDVNGNFLVDFQISPMVSIIAGAVSLVTIFGIPSDFFQLRKVVTRMMVQDIPHNIMRSRTTRKIMKWVGTPFMLLLITCLAVIIQDLEKCIGLAGSLGGIFLTSVFPGLLLASLQQGNLYTDTEKLMRISRLRWSALVLAGTSMGMATVSLMATLLAW